MKKTLLSLSLAFAFWAPSAFAQDARIGIGAAATGLFPVGDFADAADVGYGGFGSLEAGAYPGLALTARSGYIRFAEKNHVTLSHIPIMGGLKASGVDGTLYMAAEVGAVKTRVEYDGAPLPGQDRDETNVGWSVGIGSMAGPLDLRLSIHVWDAARASKSTTLGLSLGLNAFSW